MLLPSMPLPSYPDVRVTLASTHRLASILRGHDADVVHLASPFVLGWRGVLAAEGVGIPSVAVYQTDIPSYAERYGIPGAAPALTRHLGRLHRRADLTLAPSTSALDRLESLGVDRLALWRRGVDTERFAPERRSEAWRREVAPNGEIIVGYVGRLAPEKQVEDLRALADLPGYDSSSSATAPTGRRSSACCPARTSPDSSAATTWPPRWRASTCSCTPARARRSARRSRRRWRAAFPWSPRARAAPSTWCARASTAGSTVRATSPSCAAACSTSRVTTRSGGPSRCAPVRPSPAADGTVSATSSSSTTRRSPSGTARRAVSGSAGCAEAATPSHDR